MCLRMNIEIEIRYYYTVVFYSWPRADVLFPRCMHHWQAGRPATLSDWASLGNAITDVVDMITGRPLVDASHLRITDCCKERYITVYAHRDCNSLLTMCFPGHELHQYNIIMFNTCEKSICKRRLVQWLIDSSVPIHRPSAHLKFSTTCNVIMPTWHDIRDLP